MADLWRWFPLAQSRERLTGSTQLIESRASEMRISRRPLLEGIEYAYTLRDPRLAEIEAALTEYPMADWLVPVWHDRTIVEGIGATDTVLPVETAADYRVGGQAVIYAGCETWTIATIDSIGAADITLTAPVGAAYARALVAPLRTGFVDAGITYQRQRDRGIAPGVSSGRVSFTLVDDGPAAATPWPQYEGIDLVDKCGTIAPLAAAVIPAITVIDPGTGLIARAATRDFLAGRYTMAWRLDTAAETWARRRWLHYIRGRDREFWLADWQHDLALAAPIGAADGFVLVEPIYDDLNLYVGRHILVDDDVAQTPREITGAVLNGAHHRLTIAPLGRNVPAAQIAFLRKVRLATDQVEIGHAFGFYAEMSLPLVEVPE